jgi:hypothetical protein
MKLEKDVSLYGYEMLRIIYTWQRQAPLGNHTLNFENLESIVYLSTHPLNPQNHERYLK